MNSITRIFHCMTIVATILVGLGCSDQRIATASEDKPKEQSKDQPKDQPKEAPAHVMAASAPAQSRHGGSPSSFDKTGYTTFVEDGRLWVFRSGSKALTQFMEHGEPAKVVIRPAVGPNRMTVKATDVETIQGYLLSKPGYVTFVEDGRLWVFRSDSKELTQFMERGEPAKVVIRPAAGPNRMTIKATDVETIEGYMSPEVQRMGESTGG
jgi:hypothetical protein